jgi:hypothetical protein
MKYSDVYHYFIWAGGFQVIALVKTVQGQGFEAAAFLVLAAIAAGWLAITMYKNEYRKPPKA